MTKRNDGRPRTAVPLRLDPLPYRNTLTVNRYPDEDSAQYFSVTNYTFDPRPGFIQDEEAYS